MEKNFRFNLEETAGAIGDYGTLIPIIIGVAAVTDLNLAPILFFFGLSYIGIGLYYKLPMPVEPMKAIGAIAIAGNLSTQEIAGAGITSGLIFIIIGATGGMYWVKRYVPTSIIRGIQLGLALTLFRTAFNFINQDITIGVISISIIIVFFLAPILDISALVVLCFGISWGIYTQGLPPLTAFTWPELTLPAFPDIRSGFITGTIPQIPLTLGNSVLATSLLITDLFDKKVAEDKMITSVGIISLVSSCFGGFPMCHGAGGLAAQYRFGARTGGSNIISGIILLFIAFFFASQDLVHIIPFGVLGSLLFFSALQLLQSSFQTNRWFYTLSTGIIAFFFNTSAGFIIMLTIYWLKTRLDSKTQTPG
ncbi:MAG: putative sulfate/molybdate transporter [Bacillota bacterium]